MIVMPPGFNVGDTVYFPFDTYDSNGASVTITGLSVTDIEVYKNGSVTQRASDNGYALLDTDGIDFDGTVGLHGFSIDTSDNSDAGFWVDGAQYWVNVNAITVDGQTVRFTYFLSLGFVLRPTTAGRTLDVEAGGRAGIDLGNVTGILGNANVSWIDANDRGDVGSWLGTAVTVSATTTKPEVDTFSVSDNQAAADNVQANIGNLDTAISSLNDLSTADIDARLAAIGLDHLVSAAVIGTDIADNSIIAKMVSSSATADWDDFVNTTESLQALRDHIGDGTNLTEAGGDGDHLTEAGGTGDQLTAVAQAGVCTEARLSELDAGTAGKAANQIDEIRTDTEDIQTKIGTPAAADLATDVANLPQDNTGCTLAASEDVYHASIDLSKDDTNSKDEYTITWFKNGVRITSGITLPTIQVIKRADGTDLVASTAMTQIGTTGSYKYDESTNRITAGEAVVVVVAATIDAAGRTFAEVISRDST